MTVTHLVSEYQTTSESSSSESYRDNRSFSCVSMTPRATVTPVPHSESLTSNIFLRNNCIRCLENKCLSLRRYGTDVKICQRLAGFLVPKHGVFQWRPSRGRDSSSYRCNYDCGAMLEAGDTHARYVQCSGGLLVEYGSSIWD